MKCLFCKKDADGGSANYETPTKYLKFWNECNSCGIERMINSEQFHKKIDSYLLKRFGTTNQKKIILMAKDKKLHKKSKKDWSYCKDCIIIKKMWKKHNKCIHCLEYGYGIPLISGVINDHKNEPKIIRKYSDLNEM